MRAHRVVRARPNRLVEIFKAFVEFPVARVVPTEGEGGVHVGRVEGERKFVFRDGFRVARLQSEDVALKLVRPSQIWLDGERLGHQFVGPIMDVIGRDHSEMATFAAIGAVLFVMMFKM